MTPRNEDQVRAANEQVDPLREHRIKTRAGAPSVAKNQEVLLEREKMLREEIRNLRDVGLRLCQWGVTVLIALQMAIFFFRRDTYETMIKTGELKAGQYLPWDRYIAGTAYLAIVALLFSLMMGRLSDRYKETANSLTGGQTFTGLPGPKVTNFGKWIVYILFFIFPAFDIVVKLWIRFEIGLR